MAVLGRLKGFLQDIDVANLKLNTNVNVSIHKLICHSVLNNEISFGVTVELWTLKRWHLMQDKPREDYDIEVLTGEEEHYIEMVA